MASNYTEHYQLPIWAPEDSFLREEFNEANQKIDAALGQAAPASEVEALQAQLNLKSRVVVGTYSGDNQASRTIELGLTPKAVAIWTSGGRQEYGNFVYGGLALLDHPCSGAFSVVENGFVVYESDDKHCNAAPYTYYYLAVE